MGSELKWMRIHYSLVLCMKNVYFLILDTGWNSYGNIIIIIRFVHHSIMYTHTLNSSLFPVPRSHFLSLFTVCIALMWSSVGICFNSATQWIFHSKLNQFTGIYSIGVYFTLLKYFISFDLIEFWNFLYKQWIFKLH